MKLAIINTSKDLPEIAEGYAVTRDYSRQWKAIDGEWVAKVVTEQPKFESILDKKDIKKLNKAQQEFIEEEMKDSGQIPDFFLGDIEVSPLKYNWDEDIKRFDVNFLLIGTGGGSYTLQDGVKIFDTDPATQSEWQVSALGF